MASLKENHQVSPEIDSTVKGTPVDWWEAPSPNSTSTHHALLTAIDEFLSTYPASEVAGYVALATKELANSSLVANGSDPLRALNIISILAEVSAFVTMVSELNAELAYQSLRDRNVRN